MGSHIPYFRFYPADFLNGVRGLSPQETGVYVLLLCQIYEENGPLNYNILRLATSCGLSEKAFRTHFEKLVALGKIVIDERGVSNPRAMSEIERRNTDLQNNSRAGKASAEKRKQKQGAIPTTVEHAFNQTDTDTDTDKRKEEAKASQKSGTRLSPEWLLPLEWGEWARAEGLTVEAIRLEADRFRDYFHSLPGQKGVKLDWQATWRNWVRKAKELQPRQPQRNGGRHDRREFDANWNQYVDGLADGSIDPGPRIRDPFAGL